MKEFYSEDGGRYTYSDDFLDLQDLALSITSIFNGTSNFIISGCTYNADERSLSEGYVWIDGKIRKFDGASDVVLPYYLKGYNYVAMSTYANDSNKIGKKIYACVGSNSVPESGSSFIAINNNISQRFADKFLGQFAVLKAGPHTTQRIEKDIFINGTTETLNLLSKQSSVLNENLKIQESIDVTNKLGKIGFYNQDTLVSEFRFDTDGNIFVYSNNKLVYSLQYRDSKWVATLDSIQLLKDMQVGSLYIGDRTITLTSNEGNDELCISKAKESTGNYINTKIFDGKASVLIGITGKSKDVQFNANVVIGDGSADNPSGIQLISSKVNMEALTDPSLLNPKSIKWTGARVYDALTGQYTFSTYAHIGFIDSESLALEINNGIGDVKIKSIRSIDLDGSVKISGKPITDMFVSSTAFNTAIKSKVDVQDGMGLSQENFTSDHKQKLESIKTGSLEADQPNGFADALQVKQAIGLLLNKENNLKDLKDVGLARANLSVYSRQEIDKKLAGFLNGDDKYSGEIFTTELKEKLDKIKFGNFAYIDSEGVSHSVLDGFVTSKQVLVELKKKAELLLNNYTEDQKKTIRTNLDILSSKESDNRYVLIQKGFSQIVDYITDNTTKNQEQSKKILRDNIDALGKSEADNKYLTKDKLLSDLPIPSSGNERKTKQRSLCSTLGAAFSEDYQPKLSDTGWLQVTGTNTLFARQIGNIVCVQGTIRLNNQTVGGVLGNLPNIISAPKYSVSKLFNEINSNDRNRGVEIAIQASSQSIVVKQEYGASNWEVIFNVTYMV